MIRMAARWATSLRAREWQGRPLSVAVIGAGKMGAEYVKVLRALPNTHLAAVAARRMSSADSLTAGTSAVAFDDWRRMIDESRPDAVIVAVSHDVSFDLYEAVLTLGLPVLLEKPAGRTVSEVDRLLAVCEVSGSSAMVGMNRRFYSSVLAAALEVVRWGDVRGVAIDVHEPLSRVRSQRSYSSDVYDNWLTWQSIHVLDLVRVFADVDLNSVHVKRSKREGPMSLTATADLIGGGLLTVTSHFDSGGRSGLTVFGEAATIELKPVEEALVLYGSGRRVRLETSWQDLRFKPGLYLQAGEFLSAVGEKRMPGFPACGLREHRATLQLIAQLTT